MGALAAATSCSRIFMGRCRLDAVQWSVPLPLGPDGRHVFPGARAVIGSVRPPGPPPVWASWMPRTLTGSPSTD